MPVLQRIPAINGGGYSDAVVIETPDLRWIHIAGQTPRSPVSGDLAGQTEQVFDQLAEILGDLGSDLTDLVALTVYLTDLSAYGSFAAVRSRVLSDYRPVSAAVGVAALLGGVLVEVSAVAVSTARR